MARTIVDKVKLRQGYLFGVNRQSDARWLVVKENSTCRLIIHSNGDPPGEDEGVVFTFTERMLGNTPEEDEAATITYYLFPELL